MGVLLTALHLALAAWLTLRSVSAPWVVAGNTMPLRTIRADLALGAMPAVEHLGGALLLLAPLGLLLPLAGGRVDVRPLASFSRTVFAGFMVAFGVEVVRTGFAGQVFDVDTWSTLQALRDRSLDTVQFIPPWVKVAVALALGLGTLVGWRRIVTTVGEGIGKQPLTYAQGASAQLTAMLTIGAADIYGLPVSTTQVLSSGVAGTMTANGSGLQWQTIRNMLLAWVLTLSAAICLAALLYWSLRALI